ncbi:MAG TPA: hypothetical protein VF584_04950 [Longimicrobium sp.]|jgi:DNA-binding beta-propeller fold protein YncE
MQFLRSSRRRTLAVLFAAIAAAACDGDLTSPDAGGSPTVDRVAVVVNRGDRTLTVIPFAEREASRTISLGAAGAPVDLAVRGELAVVPMGEAGGVVIVNLRTGTVERMVAMARGFDARRAAFISDTVVVVTNPSRGTLTPVNPLTGRVGSSTTAGGEAPAELLRFGPRVYVLNGAAGARTNGMVTVLDTLLRPLGSAPLSGTNPVAAVARGDVLYVLLAGQPAQGNGSVSVVDVGTMRERSSVVGFGESPESMAFDARGGLYVPVRQQGLVIFNPYTGLFVRGAGSPLPLGGMDDAVRVASDPAGFVYALLPGACERAGTLVRLDPDGTPAASALTGICPTDVEFTSLPPR